MRNLLLILCIGTITLLSCDARTTKYEALKVSIEKFKNSNNIVQPVSFFPENYAEVQNDTILSNGYRVKIKNFTNMEAFTTLSKSGKTNSIQNFRRIDSEITVYKDDKLIFNSVFTNRFIDDANFNKTKLRAYLNNGISVDEIASIKKNRLVLITSNCGPINNQCPNYALIIDEYGNSNFKQIENART